MIGWTVGWWIVWREARRLRRQRRLVREWQGLNRQMRYETVALSWITSQYARYGSEGRLDEAYDIWHHGTDRMRRAVYRVQEIENELFPQVS